MADPQRPNKTLSDIDTGNVGKAAPITGEGNISKPIKADPRIEYVAALGALWWGPYVRALPRWIDSLEEDLGNAIYEQMMHDPQVSKCINDLRAAILENGYELHAATDIPQTKAPRLRIGKPKQELQSSQVAIDIHAFCVSVLDNLDRPFEDILFEMLLAIVYGNKIAELVYDIPSAGAKAGKLVLRDIRPKSRENVCFVVDNFNNVLGIMGFVPGVAWPVMPMSILANPGEMPNILPRDKFAVLSHRQENGDPRGTSLARPSYNPWYLKQQTWGQYFKWLVQSAGSSLFATTPEDAQPVQVYDDNGNLVSTMAPEDALKMALELIQNGSVAVAPAGTEVKDFPVNHESGKAFKEAIELFDRQIANAILGQTLATEEGAGAGIGSGVSAQTHADIMSQIKLYERNLLCRMIRRDILRPLVRANWGDDFVDLTPTVTMGATDADDFAADASAIASLVTAGFLDPSQYIDCDDLLGLPKRAEDWQAKAAQRAADTAKAAAAAKQPQGPGKSADFSDDPEQEEGEARGIWAFFRRKWRKAV